MLSPVFCVRGQTGESHVPFEIAPLHSRPVTHGFMTDRDDLRELIFGT